MIQPKWVSKIKAEDFYNSLAYECPKCHTPLKLEMEPTMVMASDVMADKCPDCETYILINMLHAPSIIIEGYDDYDQMEARTREIK